MTGYEWSDPNLVGISPYGADFYISHEDFSSFETRPATSYATPMLVSLINDIRGYRIIESEHVKKALDITAISETAWKNGREEIPYKVLHIKRTREVLRNSDDEK